MTTDARPPRAHVRGRALLVVAAASLVAAGGLVGIALLGGDEVPQATLQVSPIAVETLPATIPPLAVDAGDPSTGGTVAPLPPPATAAPLSPLAGQVGERGSALIEPAAARPLPRSLTIDELELWGPVRPVGLEDDGEMEIPGETEIGWYDLGAAPGEAGATVLAAHVTWNQTIGPFFKLGDLDPGAEVRVRLDDGSTRIYEVVERAMYPKDGLPNWRIFRRTGPESLVLITCGGSFNPSIRRYRDNIVVYAVPVGSEPAPADGAPAATTVPPTEAGA
jgi:hypothetical protein